MPRWAGDNVQPYSRNERVNSASRPVALDTWEPEHRVFTLQPGAEREVRVQTFYYPLWTATAGQQALTTRPADDGALLVTVPPEKTVVTLDFQEPARVHKFRLVSLAGWFLILLTAIQGLLQTRRHNPLPN